MDNTRKQAVGFTIIELLVVISIISILIAMLIPALTKSRASGHQVVCQTNLRQLGVAMEVYIFDWDGWICPYEAWYNDHNWNTAVSSDGTWYWRNIRNLKGRGSQANAYLDTAGDPFSDILNTGHGLWCPSHTGEDLTDEFEGPIPNTTWLSTHRTIGAYAYNHLFLGSQSTDAINAKRWIYRKKVYVKNPSNIITHADNAYSVVGSHTGYHYWTKLSRTFSIEDPRDKEPSVVDMLPDFRDELIYPIGEWHFGGANTVCLDGHVDEQDQEEWHKAKNDHRWREPDTPLKRHPDVDAPQSEE